MNKVLPESKCLVDFADNPEVLPQACLKNFGIFPIFCVRFSEKRCPSKKGGIARRTDI
jgi:hypothetical protein